MSVSLQVQPKYLYISENGLSIRNVFWSQFSWVYFHSKNTQKETITFKGGNFNVWFLLLYNRHSNWSTENQDSGDFPDIPIAWEMSSKKGRDWAGKGLCWAPCASAKLHWNAELKTAQGCPPRLFQPISQHETQHSAYARICLKSAKRLLEFNKLLQKFIGGLKNKI